MMNASETETCACCGKPTDAAHTHHVNHRKADNFPDNLSPRDRRCHMKHHENDRAAASYGRSRHLPARAKSTSSRPKGSPPPR